MSSSPVNTVSRVRTSKVLPPPDQLPGRFFVLVWERANDCYTIHLDDADKTSYKLGSDVQKVMTRFRVWGQYELGCKCIDLAREFGTAQGIFVPGKERAVAIFQRLRDRAAPALNFNEGNNHAGTLPALR